MLCFFKLTFKALVVYSYNNRIKDITSLRVSVDLPSDNRTEDVLVTRDDSNVAAGVRLDLENVWGHFNLFATGAGQAVAQLDLTYGVDYEPFKAILLH